MESKAFTAGVVPGGLTSIKEIKILICYILDKLSNHIGKFKNANLTHDNLLEALTGSGLCNYFEAGSAISELLDSKNIEEFDRGYRLTDDGKSISILLQDEVPITVKERALERTLKALKRQRNETEYDVQILKQQDGFLVRGVIAEKECTLFALEIYAPKEFEANQIKQNFIDNAEQVMSMCIETLTKRQDD